jgi:hypothetical protein
MQTSVLSDSALILHQHTFTVHKFFAVVKPAV